MTPPTVEADVDTGVDQPLDAAFAVRLDNFEGPFDLLLSLISKHKMDVTEVALSTVTDDFIAHIKRGGPEWDLEQTTSFLSSITLLGPRSLGHIRRAAHATLAPPPERHEEFDALFDAHFLGAVELGRETADPDRDDMRAVARNLMRFFEDESCGQCTPCRVGTEKAVKLMDRSTWDAPLLTDLSAAMRDASICGLGQAAPNPISSVLRHFPEDLR